jgi:glycosyltransferase involved in cell wall biosynthesis
MKVAYVTTYDPADVINWSGLGTYIARSLKMQGIELQHIVIRREPLVPIALARGKNLAAKVLRKRYSIYRSPGVLRSYALQVRAALQSETVDLVFSPGTLPIAGLEYDRPIAFWTDATFAAMVGFYPESSNLTQDSIRDGNSAEQEALSKAAAAIYASGWAASSAVRDHGANSDRVHVAPFGPNIDWEYSRDEVERFVSARPTDRCNLLFVGVDWQRKGGDLAVTAAEAVLKAGVPVRLDIVGCKPTKALPEFARLHGFLSKGSPQGRHIIQALLQEAHFLMLPSRAEAYGLAAVEAAAVAVPAMASQVGGLAEIVVDGVSGRCFPVDASPQQYAEAILDSLNPATYRDLALSSFNEYQTRLNWRVAGAKVASILQDIT